MADQDGASKDNKSESKVSDAIKKIFTAGVSGALISEELIRSYLSDAKIPKELLQMVLQGAQKSKDEISQRVAKEITNMLHKIDLVEEISKFAENHKFKISAEIEIEKKKTNENSSEIKK